MTGDQFNWAFPRHNGTTLKLVGIGHIVNLPLVSDSNPSLLTINLAWPVLT